MKISVKQVLLSLEHNTLKKWVELSLARNKTPTEILEEALDRLFREEFGSDK